MDIVKELKQIKDRTSHPLACVTQLQKEIENNYKKIHILNVLVLADGLEQLVTEGLFKDNDIGSVIMSYSISSFGEPLLNFGLLTMQGKPIHSSPPNPRRNIKEVKDKLYPIRDGLTEFQLNNISIDFTENKHVPIEFKIGIRDKIIDLFLSEDLKAVLNYSELEVNVKNNALNINSANRPKI